MLKGMQHCSKSRQNSCKISVEEFIFTSIILRDTIRHTINASSRNLGNSAKTFEALGYQKIKPPA